MEWLCEFLPHFVRKFILVEYLRVEMNFPAEVPHVFFWEFFATTRCRNCYIAMKQLLLRDVAILHSVEP